MEKKRRRSQAEIKRDKIAYYFGKINYHISCLNDYGLSENEIMKGMNLVGGMRRDYVREPLMFDNSTVVGCLLYLVWNMELEPLQGSSDKCLVRVLLGHYDNGYIQREERDFKERAEKYFLKPLEFQESGRIPTWNNSRHYEVWTATLPVPIEVMKEVIELIRVKRDFPDRMKRIDKACGILNQFIK